MAFQARTKTGEAFELGDLEAVAAYIRGGKIKAQTFVRPSADAEWCRASEVQQLRSIFEEVGAAQRELEPRSKAGSEPARSPSVAGRPDTAGASARPAAGGGRERQRSVRRLIATLALVPVMAAGVFLGAKSPMATASAPSIGLVMGVCLVLVVVVIYLLRKLVFGGDTLAMLGFGFSTMVVIGGLSFSLRARVEVGIRDAVIKTLERVAVGEPMDPASVAADKHGVFAEPDSKPSAKMRDSVFHLDALTTARGDAVSMVPVWPARPWRRILDHWHRIGARHPFCGSQVGNTATGLLGFLRFRTGVL